MELRPGTRTLLAPVDGGVDALAGVPEPDAWPLQHPVLYTLLWIVAIVAIFAPPLSVARYERRGRR